jgi:hypothetical protein
MAPAEILCTTVKTATPAREQAPDEERSRAHMTDRSGRAARRTLCDDDSVTRTTARPEPACSAARSYCSASEGSPGCRSATSSPTVGPRRVRSATTSPLAGSSWRPRRPPQRPTPYAGRSTPLARRPASRPDTGSQPSRGRSPVRCVLTESTGTTPTDSRPWPWRQAKTRSEHYGIYFDGYETGSQQALAWWGQHL